MYECIIISNFQSQTKNCLKQILYSRSIKGAHEMLKNDSFETSKQQFVKKYLVGNVWLHKKCSNLMVL